MRQSISKAIKRRSVDDWKSGKRSARQIIAELKSKHSLKVTSGMLSRWKTVLEKDETDESGRKDMREDTNEAAGPAARPAEGNTLPAIDGRKRTDQAVKDRAVAEYLKKERSAREVGDEFGVSDATIYAWANQAKKKAKRAPSDGSIELTPSGAGMETGRKFLKKSVERMHVITCPSCAHRFGANPPGYIESLATIALHLMNGEEP